MRSKTTYSNASSDDGQHGDGPFDARSDTRRQTIFSTTSEIEATDNDYSTQATVTGSNLKSRSASARPKRVRQGFSGQWAPEFERHYPKPIDLDKTLGKAFRESQFYSQGFGYMSGGQWFNPFSLHPHPVLEQKTDYGNDLGTFGFPCVTSFDAYLKIYGVMSDSVKNVTKYHMSIGGHMGLKLDTIKHGGRKRNKYFDQNLNVVGDHQLNNKDKVSEIITNVDHGNSGINAIWNIGQNDLGNKDKDTAEVSEKMNNPTVKTTISDRRCKRRQIYCIIVNSFLLFNIIRMISCHFMVHETPLVDDTVDGGKKDFDPMAGYIRGQGMKPPKGFGGFGVGDGPPDIYTRFMWGDLSPFWTRRPHMVTVVVIILTSLALMINLSFEYYQSDRAKRWMVPFSVLMGQITPADARLRSKYQLDKMEQNVRSSFRVALILTVIWTALWTGFNFWSALTFTEVPENLVEDVKNGLIYSRKGNRTSMFKQITGQNSGGQYSMGGQPEVTGQLTENSPKLIKLGSYEISLFWAAINSLNAFYVTGIIIWSLTYFHCLTWYIRIRFKRLNKICYALLDLSNGIIPLPKRNEFMAEVLHEHNLTSADMTIYNRFWKWYLLICHFFFVPITFWLVYIGTFYWQGTWIIKGVAWVVAAQFGFFMGVMVASGETVSNQAHLLWRWLNTLCLYEWPIVIKFRMAYLIERLGGPTLGFTCYDFFVVARETFYEMALLLGTYFFLTYEFVLSSL